VEKFEQRRCVLSTNSDETFKFIQTKTNYALPIFMSIKTKPIEELTSFLKLANLAVALIVFDQVFVGNATVLKLQGGYVFGGAFGFLQSTEYQSTD
jgi:hypothetical protein